MARHRGVALILGPGHCRLLRWLGHLPAPTGLDLRAAASSPCRVMPARANHPGWKRIEQLEAGASWVLDRRVNGTGCGRIHPQSGRATKLACCNSPVSRTPPGPPKVLGSPLCWNPWPQRQAPSRRDCRGCYRSSARPRRFWALEGRGRQDPAPGFSAGTGAPNRLPAFPSEELRCRPDQPRG